MELITHVLTGILIQILCFKSFVFPFNILLTMLFAFLSHFLIDTLAKITYHTPVALKEDKFWVYWHYAIYISSASVILIGLISYFPYLLGGLFANLVDIWDWVILRPTQNKKKKEDPDSKWGEGFFIHPIIDWIRDKPFSWLPNWNYNRKAILVEIITITTLFNLILFFLLP